MITMNRNGMFVDGQWRETVGADGATVVNPHTEEPWGRVTFAAAKDVDVAVRSAERALHGEWSRTSLDERIALVLRIRALLERRTPEFADLQARSMGGLLRFGVRGSLELIDMYIDSVRTLDFDYLRRDAFGNTLVSRRPVGVVAGIAPWNAPVRNEVKKTIPALLSGCTVVLKPAPEAPFGAALFAELCSEAGAPPGIVNLVFGAAATGEALVQHAGIRKVAFTGSSATGARIAALGSASFKRLQLELGGKSAAILLEDVDLEAALPMLTTSAWTNVGQACSSLTRVLVPRKRHRDLVDAFVTAARAQVVGDPTDPATMLGPLVSSRQRDRVLQYIEIGCAEGAKIATGGARPPHLSRGYYVAPTIMTDVRNDMRIAQEEIFGPVTCLIPYDSEAEAVALANDSIYGLHGGVFGRDEERALAIARQIDTGSVAVNTFFLPSSAPFGGVKQSGVGREHGPEGYDAFLEYTAYNVTPALAERLASRYPAG